MQREWRCGAQSSGWRAKWRRADPAAPPADLIGAFVDRAPIAWSELRARGRSAAERRLIERLRLLDRLRRPGAPTAQETVPTPADDAPRWLLVAVAGIAALQTVGCLALVAAALVAREPVPRPSRLVLACAFSAGALVVSRIAARDRRSLGLVAAFACVAAAFARGATTGLASAASPHLQIPVRWVLPIAFAPAALWQFAIAFPLGARFAGFDVAARRAAAAAWLLGAFLFGALLSAGLGWVRIAAIAGANGPARAFWHLLALAMFPAIVITGVRSQRARDGERRRILRFALTLCAGSAPFLLFALIRMTLPQVDRWFIASGPAGHAWVDRMILWPLAALPVLSSCVLLLDRPFQRQAVAGVPSRGRLASIALWLALVAPVAALSLLIHELRRVPIADIPRAPHGWSLLLAGGGSLLALLTAAWRIAADTTLVLPAADRWRLSRAIERIRLARGEREMAVVLAEEIAGGIDAESRSVLFLTSDGSFSDPSGAVPPLSGSAALAAIFRATAGPVDISERALRAMLPADERAWAAAWSIDVAAALRDRAGAPVAILVFGRSRRSRFRRRERWLTSTLIAAATVVDSPHDRKRARGLAHADGEPAFECQACGMIGDVGGARCGCRSPMTLAALPRRLGATFAIEQRLGTGGMGIVYRGRDLRLDRDVALKTVPELRGEAAARLRAEARAMAALNHAGLATLFGIEFWRGTPVLVEEYLRGGTLAARLASGPMTASCALPIACRVAEALDYMHERGVLHRDVKPGNIAFSDNGSPKLLDFGLATLIGSVSCGRAGTPAYLPPEPSRITAATASTDLWALSLTFLESIVGADARVAARVPGALAQVLGGHRVPLASERDRDALQAFFERALAHDEDARFATAAELLAALLRLGSMLQPPSDTAC